MTASRTPRWKAPTTASQPAHARSSPAPEWWQANHGASMAASRPALPTVSRSCSNRSMPKDAGASRRHGHDWHGRGIASADAFGGVGALISCRRSSRSLTRPEAAGGRTRRARRGRRGPRLRGSSSSRRACVCRAGGAARTSIRDRAGHADRRRCRVDERRNDLDAVVRCVAAHVTGRRGPHPRPAAMTRRGPGSRRRPWHPTRGVIAPSVAPAVVACATSASGSRGPGASRRST